VWIENLHVDDKMEIVKKIYNEGWLTKIMPFSVATYTSKAQQNEFIVAKT